MMIREIYFLAILCILILSTGCNSNDSTTETMSTTENIHQEIVDTEYIDEAEWEFNDTADRDETAWVSYNETVIKDISGLDWVESVSISPETYDEYIASGKVTITCTVVSDKDVTPENEKSIADYIDTSNLFEDYEIVFN